MRFQRIWITLLSACAVLAQQPIASAGKPGGDDLTVTAVFDDHVSDPADPSSSPDDLVRSDLEGVYDAQIDGSFFHLYAGRNSKGSPRSLGLA